MEARGDCSSRRVIERGRTGLVSDHSGSSAATTSLRMDHGGACGFLFKVTRYIASNEQFI